MNLKHIVIVLFVFCVSCATLNKTSGPCSMIPYPLNVEFVGEKTIAGEFYEINQYSCPGLGPISGDINCYTQFGLLTETNKSGEDLLTRPIILEKDDILLINDWLLIDFLKNMPSSEDSIRISNVSDMIVNYWTGKELTAAETIVENPRQGKVWYLEVTNQKSYVYSVDRCVVKNEYFRGLNIIWSDNETIKVAVLLPQD